MSSFDREDAVLYTYGLCNLNCRYCTIDKNPVLKDIDKEIEESFKGDYYFERIKKYFPRRDQLTRMETWGGEPFLGMHRALPTIRKCIEYYPYFRCMYSSTNFSYPEWLDEFMGLMKVFGDYPYREFEFQLQLSVDGPEYINDANRGKGVTKRCIENFDKLLELIKRGEFPKNITLVFMIKGTWDIDTIHKLNDKQKLIEFFQFYENAYIDKVQQLGNPKFIMNPSIPNLAVPAPVTKHDGEIFAEVAKKCREIEEENNVAHYFKYYFSITPFREKDCMSPFDTYRYSMCGCGSGTGMVGFLPNDKIAACHEGFTLLAEEYKKQAAHRSNENMTVTINKFLDNIEVPMCLSEDKYAEHERKMAFYTNPMSTARLASSVNLIIALAMAGEIDQKYLLEPEALKAAKYIFYNSAFCIKNNYIETGSFSMESVDIFKLLLNGALEYLTIGGQWYGSGCYCNNCVGC